MSRLLRKSFGRHGKVPAITAPSAGWCYVGLALHSLSRGDRVSGATGTDEATLVMVKGKAAFLAHDRDWGVLGDRMDVFERMPPQCRYRPAGSPWTAVAGTDCTVAVCLAPGRGGHTLIPLSLEHPDDRWGTPIRIRRAPRCGNPASRAAMGSKP